jgi:AcrR family transcriptional regulator
MNRREERKRQIIDTAFEVWGEDFFAATSLGTLADNLNMTKPALYRYFGNKEELLEVMEERFAEIYFEVCRRIQERLARGDFYERVHVYQEEFFRFFLSHYTYYRFAVIRFMPRNLSANGRLQTIRRCHQELFPAEMLEREFGWQREESRVVQRFIFSASTFLLNGLNISGSCFQVGGPADPVAIHRQLLTEGMGRGVVLPDFGKIERSSTVSREELPEQHRLFSAIAEVVGEVGLWEASLDTIARRAGMGKSSLYAHFENRSEMLWQMIERERRTMGELFLQRTAEATGTAEKLYTYFALFGHYFALRTEVLAVMNWFRFQRVTITPPENAHRGMERYVAFLDEAMGEGRLDTAGLTSRETVMWLNYLIIQEVNHHYWNSGNLDQIWGPLRNLYKLFLYGVKGD